MSFSEKSNPPPPAHKNLQPRDAAMVQEVNITSAKIVRLLDETIKRLEVGLSLSMFLEDDCQLIAPHLDAEELTLMMKYRLIPEEGSILSVYGLTSTEQLLLKNAMKDNISRMTGASEMDECSEYFDRRIDPDVARIIDVIIAKPRLHLLLDPSKYTTAATIFIEQFRSFRTMVMYRLQISTKAEHDREVKLRSLWRRNEKAKVDILKLTEKLAEQKELAEAAVIARNHTIHNQHIKIAKMLAESKEAIKSTVTESQRTMVIACKAAEARYEILCQELKDAQNMLTNDLADHLASEKQLRAKRYKVESQLASWVDKYDLDIGEKQAELEDLQAGFDEELQQLEKLQEDFASQEEEYIILMDEKEAIYIAERNEKMYIFIMNRSARRIQRWWRAYLERKRLRKLARKNKKKGKGGAGGGAKKGGGGGKKKKK